jgi:pullulanase/glycogen debranching enzyme
MAEINAANVFSKPYLHFKEKRNLVFKLIPITPGEGQIDYALRIARFAKDHKRKGDDEDIACEAMRSAGRDMLSTVLLTIEGNPVMYNGYLYAQGYSELMNVYKFTAPLDAVNWRIMKAPTFDDVLFENWMDVAALNKAAFDICNVKFLQTMGTVRKSLKSKDEDPFPTADSECIMQQLETSIVSDCILYYSRLVKASMMIAY